MIQGLTWCAALALFWLPGALLDRCLHLRRHPDWLVGLATQIGMGMAAWPLLLLWTSLIGWRWTPATAQGFALLVCLLGAATLLHIPRPRWQRRLISLRHQGLTLTFFACLFAITAVTRILQIRDLALPVWVDSVHHTMIVRLLVENGQIPGTFDPFIPTAAFNYHWGYHALVTWIAWLLRIEDPFGIADLILHTGQFLNALSVLMFYAAGRILFASRRAGLMTAALVGIVAWFPAYFVSWGRYTHLTGVLILPIVLICLWRLRLRPSWGNTIAAVLTLAGLALIHVRIAYFGASFMAVLVVAMLLRRQWRPVILWSAVAGMALLVTLPWWIDLLQSAWVRNVLTPRTDDLSVWTATNVVDWGLVYAPRNQLLIDLGTLGLGTITDWSSRTLSARLTALCWFSLIAGLSIYTMRRPKLRLNARRTVLAWLLLAIWTVLTALLLQLDRLGLPYIRISHINAGVMTLFVPLCLACAGLMAWAFGTLVPKRWALSTAGVAALLVAIWGASGMTTIVNPTTVLATQADRAALQWIRDKSPADARFAVQVWPWLSGIYAGSDGGYWIPVLTERASILPPALYASSLPPDAAKPLRDFLSVWSSATSLDDLTLQQQLLAAGVTHIYLGQRVSTLSAQSLLNRPYVTLVYSQNGVQIFQIRPDRMK